MGKNKAVTIELEGNIDLTPQSAYDAANADGYLGTEEQYAKELCVEPVSQDKFDALPGRICKMVGSTEASDFHHITDSAADKVLDFGMEGKTEQETTPGNQLFDISKFVSDADGRATNNGDGSITLFNYVPAIASNKISACCPNIVVGQTIIISGANVRNTYFGGTVMNANKAYTVTQEMLDNDKFGFYGINGTTTTDNPITISDIMINEGSTAQPYEPYTNGPSPNPDYPQEIVNAGVLNEETGRYEIGCEVVSKNVGYIKYMFPHTCSSLDIESTHTLTNGGLILAYDSENTGFHIYGTSTRDGIFNFGGSPTAVNGGLAYTKQRVLAGQTYTLSMDISYAIRCFNGKILYDDGTESSWISANNAVQGKTSARFTAAKDGYVWFYISLSTVTMGTVYDFYISNIQLELEDTATDYVPHKSNSFTLTSPVPITKWDKLVKRDGVWGWSIFGKEYNISGDEVQLQVNNASDGILYRLYITNAVAKQYSECFCNLFRHNYKKTMDEGYCGYWFSNASFCLREYTSWIKPYGYTYDSTLDNNANYNKIKAAFKAMLNDKGGIQIWVDMQEEQSFHPLPDEEQTLLNNLETYYGVTNVYNEQGCPMWLTYVQDMKTAVDNKFENIKTALISLGANV